MPAVEAPVPPGGGAVAGDGPPLAAGPPVVVLGGTGFVGRHVVARLAAERPGEVAVVARRPPRSPPTGTRFRALDLDREAASLAELASPGAGVINLVDLGREHGGAPPAGRGPVAAARRLLEACARAEAARLVHVSTVAVVGLGARGLVDESAPCRPVDAYQRRKLAVEQTLRREAPPGLDLVVLRPSAVFGKGGIALESLVASLRRGRRLVNWVRSGLFARRAMNLVPVETVAAAVTWALARPAPFSGEVLVVSADDEACNRFRDVEAALMRAFGVPRYRVPPPALPAWILDLALLATGRLRMRTTARFSPARLRSRGFIPPTSFAEALARHAGRLAAAR